MKNSILFLLSVLYGAGTLSAQDVLTFREAIATSLKQNHQIEMFRNNASMASNSARIGNADLLPKLSLSGGANYSDTDFDDPSTMTSAQLSVSYTLFDGLGNVYRFKSLQADGRKGVLDARDQIESTLLLVSQAYYGAASAFENYQIARELMAISRERFQRANQRAVYGRAMTIDVLAAQVDLSADSVTITQAGFQWDEAQRDLNLLLNRDLETKFLVDTSITFQADYTLESLMTEVMENNASYLSAGESLRRARFDLASARSAHLPKLDLSASSGFSQSNSDFTVRLNDPSKSMSLGLSLSFNLFNGFKTHIQRQDARYTLKNRELEREQARLDLEKEVTSAFEAYRNSLVVLDLESSSLEAAKLNFKRTQELYHLGQVTTTQFREAQLNLIRAKSSMSWAKYEAKLNEIILMKLSGRLLPLEG